VVVAIAAWLYIIQALLGLASMFSHPFGVGSGSSTFATLIGSVVCGAMGYGLLKREAWGRWLALGVSLLSWVFGSLLLIALLGALAVSGKSGAFISMMFSGAFAIFTVMLVIGLLIMLVSIVISFKLFFHLCSEDGCDEFDVPYGSAGTVVASVGAWVALMAVQVFMTSGGRGGVAAILAQQAMSRQQDPREQDATRLRVEARQREHERAEESRRRAEQEARVRAIRDAENEQALNAAAAAESPTVDSPHTTVVANAALPDKREEEEKTTGNTILKCRDATGAVMFTQGYCPPGSQRVDMPRKD
jgi:hypothetical protein